MASHPPDAILSLSIAQRAALLYSKAGCTPTAAHEEGPYYRRGAPPAIDLYPSESNGPILYFDGSVADTSCRPISGVSGEIWQADDLGRYDNEDPNHQPPAEYFRCRASFAVESNGAFRLRTVLPGNYAVLEPGSRWVRVKHVHFKLYASGHEPLTTEVALLPDPYTSTDPLFYENLSANIRQMGEESGRPAFSVRFDFVLKPLSATGYVLAAARARGLQV
jgi:protocatechuate 3,4-dioxygenase beta subunit